MKKRTLGLLMAIFILVIMAITNPTKAEYVSWINEKAMDKSSGFLVKGVISLFGNQIFDSATTSQNFVFFTVFKTNISGPENVPVIGVFHNFIPVNYSKGNTASITAPSSINETSASGNPSAGIIGSPQSDTSSPTTSSLIPDPVPNTDPIPSVQTGGTVNVIGKSGLFELPLIGVKAQYGIGDDEPSIVPDGKLPDIHFDIPANEADRLAVFWINLGYGDNKNGMLFIAPKDWKPKRAGIGADGSTVFTLVSDSSSNSPQTISFVSDGGCFGCAVDNIGAYFPSLKDWATKNAVVPETLEQMQFTSSLMLDNHTIAYTMQKSSEAFPTNGVAVESHANKPVFFGKAEITSPDKELATTVLNFYLQTLSEIRNTN